MRTLLAGLALLTSLTLAACGSKNSSNGGGACGSTCNGCCLGTTCVAGTDVTGCGTGSKDCSVCTSGQSCQNGLCTSGVPTAGSVADKCTTNANCQSGGLCAADLPGGGYCTALCSQNASCPSGSVCWMAYGVCVKTCAQASDCRAEQYCAMSSSASSTFCLPKCTADIDCISSNCHTDTGACDPSSRVGQSCVADTDCGQYPAFCDKTRPGGYCSLPCGGSQNIACPDDSKCSSQGGASVCLRACKASDTNICLGRTDVSCSADGSCTPPCSSNDDCAVGLRCDTGTHACVQGGPTGGVLGGACGSNPDCSNVGAGAFCGLPANGYPGGYCSISCVSAACPAGGTCVDFTQAGGAPDKNCLSVCTSASDCRTGYYCFNLGGGFGSVCTPKCTADTDCSDPTTQICDKNSGQCVAKPSSGNATTVSQVDLTSGGAIAVSTSSLSVPLTVDVPADAVSVNFVGQSIQDPTARVVVYRLEQNINGTITRLYDYASVSNQMKVLPPTGPGAFSVLYPNSPSVPFSTSDSTNTVKITIKLLASKATTATVKALIKHAPTRALASGSINLNFFFVGLSNLNATSAPSDSNFQSIVNTVKTIWGKAGVVVDSANIRYIDITGSDATKYRDLVESDLGALMQLSNNPSAADNALNIFFVHSIQGGSLEGYIILGESAGIPGVPIRGTTGSGMAVTTADFPNGLFDIADTVAHEGGHWLGLFHTTESGGSSFDPLPDTGECPQASYDTNGDKIMQPSECTSGRGAENEMFWTSVAAIEHTNMTPNQSFVLLRNPAVK